MRTRNKKFFFFSFLIILLVTPAIALPIYYCSLPDEKNPKCTGKDRWDVKILTDTDEQKINFVPQNTSVNSLIAIPPKKFVDDNTPRFGIEFNTYSLQCRIREYKLSDDGDMSLVLEDISDPEKTMIGEIPDMYCESVKQSSHLDEFIKARNYFQNTEIDTSVYIITGVAFYDKVHGQLGVAPNGIEIHPVLSIAKKTS